ncbi:MAG: hypothetical protein HC903_15880 [Methylacidiphilales bacterium]|nr:hypothetical protein [Candidatus Methylacidiphilales bacterium]NJR15359.1 hypothetical protein [Calothrix sp. CSU_2_0]
MPVVLKYSQIQHFQTEYDFEFLEVRSRFDLIKNIKIQVDAIHLYMQ